MFKIKKIDVLCNRGLGKVFLDTTTGMWSIEEYIDKSYFIRINIFKDIKWMRRLDIDRNKTFVNHIADEWLVTEFIKNPPHNNKITQ